MYCISSKCCPDWWGSDLMLGKIDRLHWYYHRWLVMDHPVEEIYRVKQFVTSHLLDRFDAVSQPTAAKGFSYFDRTGIKYSSKILAKLQPKGSPIHRFPLLNITLMDLSEIRDWRNDYNSGQSSAIEFCGSINPQDFSRVGDVKYVAVLSRFHFLPLYAIDAVIHRNQASMKMIERLLPEWSSQNPYLLSINWKTGIEVGIRSLNLVVARKILMMGNASSDLLHLIDDLIYNCLHYLVRHQSLYSSANNHLVAELLGLIVILSHYDHPNRDKILNSAARLFVDELFKQNYPDGGNREQSTQYHVEVLDAWLTGLQLLRGMGYEFDQQRVNVQLQAMGEFLLYCQAQGGSLIRIGDDDEGQYLFPYFDPDYHHSNSVLNSLSMYLGVPYLNKQQDFDLRQYLIGGDEWESKSRRLKGGEGKTSQLPHRLFEHSGYAFFNAEDSNLVMDVGEIGLRPMAAHGHSDLLSFTLDYKQIPFLVDPGTYQYHGRTPYRQYFRSVQAHNTLSVNGLNQALSGGRMIWLKQPKVSSRVFNWEGNVIFCEAEHDGFVRQGVPIVHRRRIEYNLKQRQYLITDWLRGNDDCEVSVMFHFHPEVSLIQLDEYRFLASSGGFALQLENPMFENAQLFKGSEEPLLGWYSNRYDNKEPCWTIQLKIQSHGGSEIKTILHLI